ncbi:MAG: lamin tail domain-containing protein [Nanoarchaeota archaeon]|nr:lamin tail domain-containing protein [Nanoarchaeota archaeon]
MFVRGKNCRGLGIIFLLILLFPIISSIKINEVELNPEGSDTRNEWIEFYSKEEASLNEYKIKNNDGEEIMSNESGVFSGYYVYIFEKQWLDNSNEKVYLYKGNELVDETTLLSDSKNNNFTWSYCSDWVFVKGTKGKENECGNAIEKSNSTKETTAEITPEENEKDTEIDYESSSGKGIDEIKETSITANAIKSQDYQKIEVIKLNSKDIKTNENTSNLDKQKIAIYGFVVFCILLALLFTQKKWIEKKKQGEFEQY